IQQSHQRGWRTLADLLESVRGRGCKQRGSHWKTLMGRIGKKLEPAPSKENWTAIDLAELNHAAELIARSAPSAAMVSTLSNYASSLRDIIRSDENSPGRPELRRRLKKIATAARLIEGEITDPAILGLLVTGERVRLLNEYEMFTGLRDLIERVETAFKLAP